MISNAIPQHHIPSSRRALGGGHPPNQHHNQQHNQQNYRHNHPQQPTMGSHHYHHQQQQQHQQQQFFHPQQHLSHLTVEQVRHLHARALAEAEAKRTELRLVVTSRYKELVGSSDEVMKMQEQAVKLHDAVSALPGLMTKLVEADRTASGVAEKNLAKSNSKRSTSANVRGASAASRILDRLERKAGEGSAVRREQQTHNVASAESSSPPRTLAEAVSSHLRQHGFSARWMRNRLSVLPRRAHRALDKGDPHAAALALAEAFTLVCIGNVEGDGKALFYPLAKALSVWKLDEMDVKEIVEKQKNDSGEQEEARLLACQVHMVYMHIQSLPLRTVKIARNVLLQPSPSISPNASAGALVSLALLDPTYKTSAATSQLLDVYYDSKSKLLTNLLSECDGLTGSHNANELTKKLHTIVSVVQHDVVLHSHKIFFQILPDHGGGTTLNFDPDAVRSKCSRFLAAHLPLLKSRTRTVLSSVSTASYLAKIRQSLYDQTNVPGEEWDVAVREVVDLRVVTPKMMGAAASQSASRKSKTATRATSSGGSPSASLSLWTVLFSQTFDSLVEGLLRTSCVALRSTVVSTLKRSLSAAPPAEQIRAHEVYRNCQLIALNLNASLQKLSDDAWKLVHHEERDLSSIALKQSLYVQTCETVARLLCELRVMSSSRSSNSGLVDGGETVVRGEDAGRCLIVAVLCHQLKYRLTSLRTLLDTAAAPSGRAGTITVDELRSAFDIADDDGDGLLSTAEAREAMEAAFSGSALGGADAVNSMLSTAKSSSVSSGDNTAAAPTSLNFEELVLLATRGLRHSRGGKGALGTIQTCLDSMVDRCLDQWAKSALSGPKSSLSVELACLRAGWSVKPKAWLRLHGGEGEDEEETENSFVARSDQIPLSFSSFVVAFVVSVSSELNRVVCPRDFLVPVGSVEEAESLGIQTKDEALPPTLVTLVRAALLRRTFLSIREAYQMHILDSAQLDDCCRPCLLQIIFDIMFVRRCFDRCLAVLTLLPCDGGYIDGMSNGLEKIEEGITAKARDDDEDKDEEVMYVLLASLREKLETMSTPFDLYLSSLFDDDAAGRGSELGKGVTSQVNWEVNPLPSSRRFLLLPIQSERQLAELQLEAGRGSGGVPGRGEFVSGRDGVRGASGVGSQSLGGTATSGFGFFTSMKWKK